MVAAVVFSGMPHDDVVKQEGADIASLAAVMQRPLLAHVDLTDDADLVE